MDKRRGFPESVVKPEGKVPAEIAFAKSHDLVEGPMKQIVALPITMLRHGVSVVEEKRLRYTDWSLTGCSLGAAQL